MKLVLLHSPLVGPQTWPALALRLRARGHDVALCDFTPVMQGDPPFYPRLAAMAADVVTPDSILVAHSGAGALVPAIAQRVSPAGAIFVDALLPHPGRSWFDTAPEALRDRLRGLTRDGRLPPWHRWWPKGAIEALLPDAAMYEQFVAGLLDLPLAYFEERAPSAAWEAPCSYLQLSSGYEAEAVWAQAQSWRVSRLKLHHLAMLTHPDAVVAAIEGLVIQL